MFWEACQPQLAECGSAHLPVSLKPFWGQCLGVHEFIPLKGKKKWKSGKTDLMPFLFWGSFCHLFRVLSLQLSDIGVQVYPPVLLGDDPPPSRHFWNKWFSGFPFWWDDMLVPLRAKHLRLYMRHEAPASLRSIYHVLSSRIRPSTCNHPSERISRSLSSTFPQSRSFQK